MLGFRSPNRRHGRRHPSQTRTPRKLPPSPHDSGLWLWLAFLNLLLALAFLFFFIAVAALSASSAYALDIHIPVPWDEEAPELKDAPPKIEPVPVREKVLPPPAIQPYKIPRFGGREGDDFHHIPPVKLSRMIDADAVFQMVVNCFPERPKWGLEVKAVAGARYTENNTVSTFDTAGLARYYAGIVAEMPLYSADEQFRIREMETKRRGEAAANVAALLKALADRDRALRMIGIGESVEARSQERVQQGIAPAEEQIGYLKEVAGSTGDLAAAQAAIIAARLALVGQCRDEVYDQINNYLAEVTR